MSSRTGAQEWATWRNYTKRHICGWKAVTEGLPKGNKSSKVLLEEERDLLADINAAAELLLEDWDANSELSKKLFLGKVIQ